jgi:hypothetical protein
MLFHNDSITNIINWTQNIPVSFIKGYTQNHSIISNKNCGEFSPIFYHNGNKFLIEINFAHVLK